MSCTYMRMHARVRAYVCMFAYVRVFVQVRMCVCARARTCERVLHTCVCTVVYIGADTNMLP